MNKKAEFGDESNDDETVVVEDQEEEIETEQVAGEQDSTGDQDDAESGDNEGDDDEVIVSIGEEAPPPDEHAQAPGWVKELRKANREKEKRIRELEAKLNQTTEKKPVALGAKPKLEDYE